MQCRECKACRGAVVCRLVVAEWGMGEGVEARVVGVNKSMVIGAKVVIGLVSVGLGTVCDAQGLDHYTRGVRPHFCVLES